MRPYAFIPAFLVVCANVAKGRGAYDDCVILKGFDGQLGVVNASVEGWCCMSNKVVCSKDFPYRVTQLNINNVAFEGALYSVVLVVESVRWAVMYLFFQICVQVLYPTTLEILTQSRFWFFPTHTSRELFLRLLGDLRTYKYLIFDKIIWLDPPQQP